MSTHNTYLAHHGIKGQRWGVRRYQNPDGSLTEKGAKRYGSQYKKYMVKSQEDFQKKQTSMYVRAHNRAANELNRTGESLYTKRTGKDPNKNVDAYNKFIENEFDKRVNKYQNAEYKQFMDTNKHAQAGHALAKKYGLYNTDALAKDNKLAYDTMTKNAGDAAKPKPQQQTSQKESRGLSDGQKTALKIGAVAAGTALAAYGGYKLSQHVRASKEGHKMANEMFEDMAQKYGKSKVDKVWDFNNPISRDNKIGYNHKVNEYANIWKTSDVGRSYAKNAYRSSYAVAKEKIRNGDREKIQNYVKKIKQR